MAKLVMWIMRLISKLLYGLGYRAKPDYKLISYSQEGEDLVLRRFLKDETEPGFYVDIGAHHPERFSNTAYYSKLGWRGINIDADPNLIDQFIASRPNDINLALGVGLDEAAMVFHIFNEKALNTFDENLAAERSKVPHYYVEAKRKVAILPLAKILKDYLPKGQKISFMSVDVEGKDLEVLKSNDWSQYRPDYIITECLEARRLLEIGADPVVKYLTKQGYEPIAKTLYSIFFQDVSND